MMENPLVREAIFFCVGRIFHGCGHYEEVRNEIQAVYDITNEDFERLVVELIEEGRLVRSPRGFTLETRGDDLDV